MPKPDGLFSIGEIAVSSGLSINAIRFYETKALIKPSSTCPKSGYRYYSRENLLRLRTIIVLKNAGLSLQEIGDYLDGERYTEKKIEELTLQRDFLNRAIEDLIIRTVKTGDLTVHEIELPERFCLCRTIQAKDADHALSAIGAFYEELIRKGITISYTWPEFCEYPDYGLLNGKFPINDFTVTACLPVENEDAQPEAVRYPPGSAVSVNYRGDYFGLWKAYEALHQYMATHGYVPSGYPQEIYIEIGSDGAVQPDSLDNITCVIVPVRK